MMNPVILGTTMKVMKNDVNKGRKPLRKPFTKKNEKRNEKSDGSVRDDVSGEQCTGK